MKNLMEEIRMTRLTTICISSIILSLMFAGQSYAKVDPETILGAWLLDEGTGNIAADASGNGNDGTLMGSPAWVPGQSGTALRFTGSGTYVTCGNPETFNINVFSVSFWYNIPATQGWNHMVSRGSHVASGTPGSVNWGVMMYDAQQTILYETYNNTGWTGISVNTTTGAWHHVVATYDGATMQLYHDGQLADTSAAGILLDQSRPFVIGARSDAGSPAPDFNGSIDEVGYFSAVLTAEDVQLIMKDGLGAVAGVANPRARRPDPKDGALVAQTWLSMSWTAGDFAVTHDMYLGESFEDVNAGAANTLRGNLPSPLFLVGLGMPGDPYPAGLVPGTTYYWRVDEVNQADPNSPWKGPVWSFSVPPRKAYEPNPPDGAKYVDTGPTLRWAPGLNTRLHYVYFGNNIDTVRNATGGAPMGTASYKPAGPLQPNTTYYWRVDEFDAAATYKGDVWSFTTAKTGGGVKGQYYKGMAFETLVLTRTDPQINFNWGDPGGPDPAVGNDQFSARWTGEIEAAFTETYTFYASADDGVRLWVDGKQLVNAWVDQGTTEYSGTIDLVAGNTYSFVMEYYENGGGAVAELRWSSPHTPKQIIPQAALSLPVRASSPIPASGASSVSQNPLLQWQRGDFAASHEVYFGTDPNAVKNATKTSPEYKGTRTLGSESYAATVLDWQTTYYWRVDEVNNVNPASPWVGNVWSFTTADHGIVDDFESYNDIAAGQPGSNLVYSTWLDGFGTTTNGSTMGYPTGSSLETANVHGGGKAVPLIYNNSTALFSEVERTFAAQDWTSHGIQTLSLCFCGAATNVPGQLYVKINGVKVLYDGDASNLKKPVWQTWNVALASAGVNVQSVTKLAIGIETKGATGTLLLDDIRLYALPRELITPVQPDPAGLVARFAFDGNANDSVGGHNGTANGGPTYVPGKIGQAISLDGLDDNVVVGNVGITGAAPRTIAGWAKMNVTTGITDWTNIFGFSGTSSNNLHFDIEVVGGTTTTTAGYYGLHVYGWERNIMPPDLEWHHLAATYDGTTVSWYGDGLLVGSAARAGLNTLGNVRMGNRQDNTAFFPGLVDEVQIYSRVLSGAEVAGLAGMTKPFDKPF